MKMKDVIRRAMMARLPSCQEWNTLMDVVGKSRDAAHWAGAFSWGQDADPCFPPNRVILGCYTPRYFSSRNTSYQHKVLGFRPVFDALDHAVPDGAVVRIGTLYMDGQPVKIPSILLGMATSRIMSPAQDLKYGRPWVNPPIKSRLSRPAAP